MKGTEHREGKRLPHEKISWKPGTMLFPLPVVMVTSQEKGQKPNIITIAWTGIVCTNPPMLTISINPSRHSFKAISHTREFVVNIPSVKEARVTDWCGVVSGRDVDKFAVSGLTQAPAEKVLPPIIAECPINLECRVEKFLDLGSHTLFIAEILNVQVTEFLVDTDGRLALEKTGLVAFAHGNYFAMGKHLGHFGFSVRKRKSARKPVRR